MPEVISDLDLWRTLTEVGLTGWLIISIIALVTRKVITRGSYEEHLKYVEARRQEEREARIDAEKRLNALTERWDRALHLLAAIEKETIRATGGRRHDP